MGCLSLRGKSVPKSGTNTVTNPVFVAQRDPEATWEQLVDVVHDYFEIARENRLDGIIETRPKVASSLLEPWHKDSVGLANRLEGSLQSMRRRGIVCLTPTPGGYMIGVEIFKEQEDVRGTPDKSVGGSTFQENRPLQRDLTLVVGDSVAPKGWISLGRDRDLEDQMLSQIQRRLSLRETTFP